MSPYVERHGEDAGSDASIALNLAKSSAVTFVPGGIVAAGSITTARKIEPIPS
jgi:hypothetical protein